MPWTTPESVGDVGLEFASAKGRWVIAATVLGSGIAFLDSTVVNVALPHIGEDLDTTVAGLQWVLNGYLVTLSALILLRGSLGDLFGRKECSRPASSSSRWRPAGARWHPTTRAGVGPRGPGDRWRAAHAGEPGHPRGQLQARGSAPAPSAWSGLSGVAAAVGPFVGGWLVDAASWRWIFLINLPLSAVVVGDRRPDVPESFDPRADRRIDGPGACWWRSLGALSWGSSPPATAARGAQRGAHAGSRRGSNGGLRGGRVPQQPPDAATGHLQVRPVPRRQPRDRGRVRGAGRGVLPAHHPAAAGAGLLGARGGRGDAADHRC